jgi:beta-glucosidase
VVQTPMDVAAGGRKAREIGGRSAVLLQNNGALPFRTDVASLVIVGKASQVYARQAVAGGSMTGKPMGAGGGSSDVVPHYTVDPADGIRNALKAAGNTAARVKLILVDDANATATIDGAPATFAAALAEAGAADAVAIMAGTISEEGADRATFTAANGKTLAASAALGSGLDWYAAKPSQIATAAATGAATDNVAQNSNTGAMIAAVMAARSAKGRPMAAKTALVLKDNAGIAVPSHLTGRRGPAILEVWFPGQEDGNIVADLLFGLRNPAGKLPVTMPYAGKGFLDALSPSQFPGITGSDGRSQTVAYDERLHIGYRWYDANVSGKCAPVRGRNPCIAFPFGHGLSYTRFAIARPRLSVDAATGSFRAATRVTNTGKRAGAEVVQVYLSLPASANALGAAQPPRRLVGMARVELAPGETRKVSVTVDPAASNHPLGVWNEAARQWTEPKGVYTVWLGNSSSPTDLQRAGSFTR